MYDIPQTKKHQIAAFLDFPNYVGAINTQLHKTNCHQHLEHFLVDLGPVSIKNLYNTNYNGLVNCPYLSDFSKYDWKTFLRLEEGDIDVQLIDDVKKIVNQCEQNLTIVIISGDKGFLIELELLSELGYDVILLSTHKIINHKCTRVEIKYLPNVKAN